MKLTQRTVDALKPGERCLIWDDAGSGLAVRITAGALSYVVDFRIRGRQRRVAIGATSAVTLAQARDRAREIVAGAKRGDDVTIDPRRGLPTFGEVWRRMIDEVDTPRLTPATIADYEDRAKRLILPQLGRKLISDVTEADVDKVVSAATGQRNRAYVVVLVKKTINFARRARILGADHRNPAADVSVKRSVKKGRAIEAALGNADFEQFLDGITEAREYFASFARVLDAAEIRIRRAAAAAMAGDDPEGFAARNLAALRKALS